MNVRYLKVVLWGCRLIPIIFWGVFLAWVLFEKELFRDSILLSTIEITIFILILPLYLALVYFLIPDLLTEGQVRSTSQKFRDFFITGFTLGLYMVVGYWKKVDPSLNRMIKESQKEEIGKQEVKNVSMKMVVSIVAIALFLGLIIFLSVTHFSEWGRWEHDIRPSADDFLEKLVKKDYEGLFTKYAVDSSMNSEEFFQQLEIFENDFGKIHSYEFKTSTKSSQAGELTSFYIYYLIELNSGKKYQADFSVAINRELNRPYKNKLELFEVHNRGTTVLFLPLIKTDK